MIIEVEKYPVITLKLTVNEMIENSEKVKELVIGNIQKRHR